MTSITRSQFELLVHTETLRWPNTIAQLISVDQDANSTTEPSEVIDLNIIIPTPPVRESDAFDRLLSELESTEEGSLGLMEGRKWVAETFPGKAPTLSTLRMKKGWSQKKLASEIQSSQSYVARLELGSVDPGIRVIKKIAKALGIPGHMVFDAIEGKLPV